MNRWEYMSAYAEWERGHPAISHINGRELPNWKKGNVYDTLNALGDEGWELVAVAGSYIFKRPKAG